MSGHSKWATTKHRKAAVDAKRGKIFSVISKELTLAAKSGGGDPTSNARLRTLLNKAKSVNMPSENVERAVKKGTGELPGVEYIELLYEGYGPGGVGIIVEVTTDNKNRSASDVRSTFTKYAGNIGGPGSLAHYFQRKGQFIVDATLTTEDQLMEVVLDAGAEDIQNLGEHFQVLCPMAEYDAVSSALEDAKIPTVEAELAYMPTSTMPISDIDVARKCLKLIDVLDGLDDVQHVYANYDIPDALMKEIEG
jgi:YebC/PmpR family DNA-binding regulatory protein